MIQLVQISTKLVFALRLSLRQMLVICRIEGLWYAAEDASDGKAVGSCELKLCLRDV